MNPTNIITYTGWLAPHPHTPQHYILFVSPHDRDDYLNGYVNVPLFIVCPRDYTAFTKENHILNYVTVSGILQGVKSDDNVYWFICDATRNVGEPL